MKPSTNSRTNPNFIFAQQTNQNKSNGEELSIQEEIQITEPINDDRNDRENVDSWQKN